MFVILVFIAFITLCIIIVNPLFLLAGGRIFRVSQLTYKKALSTWLLILLFVVLLRIAAALFYALGIGKVSIEILTGIAAFLIAMWIIKRRFNTTMFRSIGVYLTSIVFALVLALFLTSFVVQAYKIPSGAMRPTLLVGDHILVNKFIYSVKIPFSDITLIPVKEPKRGDIVVFIYPEDRSKDFIKRLIGVPGDTIEIRKKRIILNGLPYNDKHGVYVDNLIIPGAVQPRDNFGPVRVPEGSFFVMGDNRDHSYDSRFWGFVDRRAIKGKAINVYWSWDRKLNSVRWDRIGKYIHY